MHQSLDASAGPGHRQLFQKAAQLHDERHLTRRKILADDDRRDECDGHQHVSLDVKCGDQPDDGLQNDGHSAQENGHPRGIDAGGERQMKHAAQKGRAAENEKSDVPPGAAII